MSSQFLTCQVFWYVTFSADTTHGYVRVHMSTECTCTYVDVCVCIHIHVLYSAHTRYIYFVQCLHIKLQVHEPKTKVDLTKYLENQNFQ